MKRSFMLFAVFVACFGLFAEGVSKGAKVCSLYTEIYEEMQNGTFDNSDGHIPFISDWFDHLEEADDNSSYSKDFLQEHGGRVGTLVVEKDVPKCVRYGNKCYITKCSGTLIGKNYFLTAGHCAVDGEKNVGVLFGYQKADIESSDDDEYDDDDEEISDDDNDALEYPRVSLRGYLDKKGIYRRYGEEVPDMDIYSNFMEHPAYFPIVDDYVDCNPDGSVEHGWKHICTKKDNEENDDDHDDDNEQDDSDVEYLLAENIPWPNAAGEVLGKMDFAIYKLDQNHDLFPENAEDPWPWYSENNQPSQNNQSSNNTFQAVLFRPWELPDNTNGKRGWARVNTAVQQTGSTLNIIGHPDVVTIPDGTGISKGLKIVNAGSVDNGKGHAPAQHFDEDLLIFKDADIWFGNSGSSVIDYSGRLAGVVTWFGCIPGLPEDAPYLYQMPPIEPIDPIPLLNATNYATPMWKICRASHIIKSAAQDMNCNGRIDWWDLLDLFKGLIIINPVIVDDLLIDRFGIHPIPLDLKNYRYDVTQQKVITETREIPAYTYQVAWSDNGDFFYLAKQSDAFYLFKNGTALGTVSNAPEISGSTTLVKGNDIYLAGGYTANIRSNDFSPYITKISSDGQNGYTFSMVADLPSDFEDIRIFSLGNDIYVSGNTDNSFVIYELVPNNQGGNPYTLSLVSDTSQPVRKDYNLTAADGKIIVSGGATDYISTVLNINEEDYPSTFSVYGNIIMLEPAVSSNWVTVAENINDKVIMLSVTAIDDGKLVIVNPFITVGNSMQKIVLNLSDIPINNENIRVSFEFHPVGFCLSESDNSVAGGMETSGECVPFAHPFYNSFSAGTTVYSVAGKGDRLYAGTNDSIKIYDISDPNSPVLVSSFSTNNARVNDLEIEGDVLFAATSKGLYKLDASDPDELEQILFVSTGSTSQNEIELYDGKVYVGDNDGIKIREKETLSVLLSANSGQVYDFAIENGEIAMFRSSFFNSGIQFRNAETLVETAYDYTSCNDVEVESFNGKLYLACDNYTYSFEANNGYIYFTQLSGDKRDLRENYTYNGYSYTPDGNYIRLSTNEEVPAICGNGIVEGDEVCDGTPIDCTELDESYVSGIAACNSTCDGYILDNCTAGNGGDGW